MRLVLLFLCVLVASCSGNEASSQAPLKPSTSDGALSKDECEKLVRRELSALWFEGSPAAARLSRSCQLGRGSYKRSYFNCVFESTYSDSFECAYKARGIDRTKEYPELKYRKVGDYGSYSASAALMARAIYHGDDPHKTIDHITLNTYLTRRDQILQASGLAPAKNGRILLNHSSSSTSADGQDFFVVEESFPDVQLVKVVLDKGDGFQEVICARYGSPERLTVESAYCAALIGKYFHVSLTQ